MQQVAWQLPGGVLEAPIPGSCLSLYIATATGNRAATIVANSAASPTPEDQAAILTATPNPFTDKCSIQFRLTTASSQAVLVVYDIQGRLVQKPLSGNADADKMYIFTLKSGGLSPGIYNVRLTTDTEVIHKRIVLAR